MGIQEEDGQATDEEEQESQESDAWRNLDQGKLQQEGANQKESGSSKTAGRTRDKKFSEEGQGEPERTQSGCVS